MPAAVATTADPDRTWAAVSFLEKYRLHRELYQRLYGATRYDRPTRALTIRAHCVRAVMVPPLLGAAAHAVLGNRRLPIYTVGGGSTMRWVFLSACPTPHDDVDRLEIEMLRVPVTTVGAGAELALPTPGDGRRIWMYGPPDGTEPLPPFVDITEAVSRSRRG